MALEFYYGEKCPHCLAMKPLIERLAKEMKMKVESYEVWHDDENLKKFEARDREGCGGVPFLYHVASGKGLCGEVSYAELEAWAKQ